jgi:DNA-binding SARP family transcriptional activator
VNVQFRILGGVAVVADDGEVTRITARRQRALLALLILNANRVMGSAVLVDELWGEALPDAPVAALQVVVSRLRTRLGPFGSAVAAEPGGYRLDVGPDETDLLVAEALLRDGRSALACNDAAHAAHTFERALALWAGDALDDLADLPFAGEAARRLRELRLSLIEARNDALLADARHLEVLADIEALVSA